MIKDTEMLCLLSCASHDYFMIYEVKSNSKGTFEKKKAHLF